MRVHAFPYLVLSVIWLSVSYSIFFLFNDETIRKLGREDGFYETVTAINLLITAVLYIHLYMRDRRGSNLYIVRTGRNLFYLLLGIVFLFGAGEEISWGQRIFNIQTPEFFQEYNIQKETNIHNLEIFHGRDKQGKIKTGLERMLNMDRLFSIFWFTFCLGIPILNRLHAGFSRLVRSANFPVVPISVGVLFILNYLTSKAVEHIVIEQLLHFAIEIKESNYAFLFLVTGLWFLRHSGDGTRRMNPRMRDRKAC